MLKSHPFARHLRSKFSQPPPKRQSVIFAPDGDCAHKAPSAYPYRPLIDSDIRLLRILPRSSHDDQIRCLLEQMPLSSKPLFYTLSYVWGDEMDKQGILVEGIRFRVTRNLYEALRQIRDMPGTASDIGYPNDYFWVDAICINQEDIDERNRQVPRMGDIYHSSFHTYIWLGPNGPSSGGRLTGRLVQKLASHVPQLLSAKHPDNILGSQPPSPDDVIEVLFEKASSLWMEWQISDVDSDNELIYRTIFGSYYDAVFQASVEILQRPWFRRVWTLQEACADIQATMLSGRHAVDYDNFIYLQKELGRHYSPLLFARGSHRLIVTYQIKLMFHSSTASKCIEASRIKLRLDDTMIRVLHMMHYKESTNPRDHIYGLIGLVTYLAQEDLPRELLPNYRQSLEKIFWQYAAYLIGSRGGLSLLSCRTHGLQDVPSWVPDFRSIGGPMEFDVNPNVSLSPDKRTLHVGGIYLGTVIHCIQGYNLKDIVPTHKSIPQELSRRIETVEENIVCRSATARGVNFDDIIPGLLRTASTLYTGGDTKPVRHIYDALRQRYGPAKRSWFAKRRMTIDTYGIETALAEEFHRSFIVTEDGTIACMKLPIEIKIGDVVCVFKGAASPNLVRPAGKEEFTFVSRVRIESGTFHLQRFDEAFWADKVLRDFRLV